MQRAWEQGITTARDPWRVAQPAAQKVRTVATGCHSEERSDEESLHYL